MAIIDSPRTPSRRGGAWYIIGVVWGVTGSKHFSLLTTRQPPPLSYLVDVAAAAAITLRDSPWFSVVLPCRLVYSPPPDGPPVSEVYTRAAASFATTTSPFLPKDDLVGPCHE